MNLCSRCVQYAENLPPVVYMNLFQEMCAVRRKPTTKAKTLPFPLPWHSSCCYQYSLVHSSALQKIARVAEQLCDSLPVWTFTIQKRVFMRYYGIACKQRAWYFEFRAFFTAGYRSNRWKLRLYRKCGAHCQRRSAQELNYPPQYA